MGGHWRRTTSRRAGRCGRWGRTGGLGGVGIEGGDTPGRWLQEARREIEFRASQTGSAWNIPFLNLFQRDLCLLLFASDERSRFGLFFWTASRRGKGSISIQFNGIPNLNSNISL